MGMKILSLEAVRTIARAQFFAMPETKLLRDFIHERKPLPSLPFRHSPKGWTFKLPNERSQEAKAA